MFSMNAYSNLIYSIDLHLSKSFILYDKSIIKYSVLQLTFALSLSGDIRQAVAYCMSLELNTMCVRFFHGHACYIVYYYKMT